jgi:hypothetical protein
MAKSVLLDTSFFIRLLNANDPLCNNAGEHFRHFMANGMKMVISTIAIAEFCIRGNIDELPIKDLQILPFSLKHAERTGKLARIVFQNKGKLNLNVRNIIPNDTKLFAQADYEASIGYYLSADEESLKIYDLLKREASIDFKFLNLKEPHTQNFGSLF